MCKKRKSYTRFIHVAYLLQSSLQEQELVCLLVLSLSFFCFPDVKSKDVVPWVLSSVLSKYIPSQNPHVRQAACIWLLSLVKKLSQHKEITVSTPDRTPEDLTSLKSRKSFKDHFTLHLMQHFTVFGCTIFLSDINLCWDIYTYIIKWFCDKRCPTAEHFSRRFNFGLESEQGWRSVESAHINV